MNTSTDQDERDESELKEVLVELPDALNVAAQAEAKRLGLSLEQWVTNLVVTALIYLRDEQAVQNA